jgi:hypothetical protein
MGCSRNCAFVNSVRASAAVQKASPQNNVVYSSSFPNENTSENGQFGNIPPSTRALQDMHQLEQLMQGRDSSNAQSKSNVFCERARSRAQTNNVATRSLLPIQDVTVSSN